MYRKITDSQCGREPNQLNSNCMSDAVFNFMTAEQCQLLLRQAISETLTISEKQAKQPEDSFLTRCETAKVLRISLMTLQKYTELGLVRSRRIGNRVLYSSEDVQTAVAAIADNKYKRV